MARRDSSSASGEGGRRPRPGPRDGRAFSDEYAAFWDRDDRASGRGGGDDLASFWGTDLRGGMPAQGGAPAPRVEDRAEYEVFWGADRRGAAARRDRRRRGRPRATPPQPAGPRDGRRDDARTSSFAGPPDGRSTGAFSGPPDDRRDDRRNDRRDDRRDDGRTRSFAAPRDDGRTAPFAGPRDGRWDDGPAASFAGPPGDARTSSFAGPPDDRRTGGFSGPPDDGRSDRRNDRRDRRREGRRTRSSAGPRDGRRDDRRDDRRTASFAMPPLDEELAAPRAAARRKARAGQAGRGPAGRKAAEGRGRRRAEAAPLRRRDRRLVRSGGGRRRPVDGVTGGAMAVTILVGLSMLAVVEHRVLNGGGAPQAADNDLILDSPIRRIPQQRRPDRDGGAGGRSGPPPVQTLDKQVQAIAQEQLGGRSGPSPIGRTTRMTRDRTWAFGTTAIPAPADGNTLPQVALYLARWSGGRWRVALSGTSAFTTQLRAAPASIMPRDERTLLTTFSRADGPPRSAAADTAGLMLPWRVGQKWTMTAARGGEGRPLGAVAFRGGDGRVLAAGSGRMYRFCDAQAGHGLVMVVHGSGLATTYDQMAGVTRLRNGSPVGRGDVLGRTGTDRACGGAAASRGQVRFALRRGTDEVPFDGAQIGGWVFRERAEPLVGWAERNGTQVLPGNTLANLGPVKPGRGPGKDPAKGDPPDSEKKPPGEGLPLPPQATQPPGRS